MRSLPRRASGWRADSFSFYYWIVGASFIGCGLWALKPDTLEEHAPLFAAGAFVTTLIAFFLAEMGDKTQLATVALAARCDELTAVVLGTTLGMMVANAPAVWVGEALAGRINMKRHAGLRQPCSC